MDKLAGMEMFVRVVDCGSFTAAADVCGVSTTMVAKQIRAIEERLGARMLHRTTRRQQLTEVGQLYYDRCLRVLSEFSLAENSALELQSSPQGLVKMFAPISFGYQFLVPELSVYMSLNPDVDIMLTLENKISNFSDGNYEIAIQVGSVNEPGVVARPLKSYNRIMAASPHYLRIHGIPKHPEELKDYSCLGISYWLTPNRWDLIGPDNQLVKASVKGRFMSNQGNALRIAALNDCGIVLQPESILQDDILQGNLVQVLPEWSYKPTPMFLTYQQDCRPSAKLRSLIDFIMDRFGME